MRIKKILISLMATSSIMGLCIMNNTSLALASAVSSNDLELIEKCYAGDYLIIQEQEEVTDKFLDENRDNFTKKNYTKILDKINQGSWTFIEGVESSDTLNERIMYLNASNAFLLLHRYNGYDTSTKYSAKVKYIDSTGDVVEYPSKVSVKIESGNLKEAGTQHSQKPVVTHGEIDKVSYTFGMYVVRYDGTYWFFPGTITLGVKCYTGKQPDPIINN